MLQLDFVRIKQAPFKFSSFRVLLTLWSAVALTLRDFFYLPCAVGRPLACKPSLEIGQPTD